MPAESMPFLHTPKLLDLEVHRYTSFTDFYKHNYATFLTIAMRCLPTKHDAEDVVSAAMADFFETWDTIKQTNTGFSDYKDYCFHVLLNKVGEFHRAAADVQVESLEYFDRETLGISEEAYGEYSFLNITERLKKRLSRQQARTLGMLAIGFTKKEIAAELHIKQAVVDTYLRNARTYIRETLRISDIL